MIRHVTFWYLISWWVLVGSDWRHRSLKLPLSCEVVEKRWFWVPRFVGGEDTPDFGHAFSNRTHFRRCGRFWLSSVQRARRVADENRRRRRIEVKPKSADDYVYGLNSGCQQHSEPRQSLCTTWWSCGRGRRQTRRFERRSCSLALSLLH